MSVEEAGRRLRLERLYGLLREAHRYLPGRPEPIGIGSRHEREYSDFLGRLEAALLESIDPGECEDRKRCSDP